VPIFSRVMVGFVNWPHEKASRIQPRRLRGKQQSRGRGETFAYWYLRRHGHVMIARNFTDRGRKGEIELEGYDGATVAFVEVKTRTAAGDEFGSPEEAVTHEKQRHLSLIARQFLREYRAGRAPFRFDVLAIEAPPGRHPGVRLHKGAVAA
jgi:putative endonuclease